MIIDTFKNGKLHTDEDAGLFAWVGTTLIDFAPHGQDENGTDLFTWSARQHNGLGECIGTGVDTRWRAFRKSVNVANAN